MEFDLAAVLMKKLDKLDAIFNEIHLLTEKMPADEGRQVRRIMGTFVGDMYTMVEMDIGKTFPALRRDKGA